MLNDKNSPEQLDNMATAKQPLLGSKPMDPTSASSWQQKNPKTNACLGMSGIFSLFGIMGLVIYLFNKKDYYSKVSIKNSSKLVVQDLSPGWQDTITPATHDGLLFSGYKAIFADYNKHDEPMKYWNVVDYITQENCTIALGTNSATSLKSYTTCEGVNVQPGECYTTLYQLSEPKHASSHYYLCEPIAGPNGQARYLRGSWSIFASAKPEEHPSAFLSNKL